MPRAKQDTHILLTRLFVQGAQEPKAEEISLNVNRINGMKSWPLSWYQGPDVVEVDSVMLDLTGDGDGMVVEGTVEQVHQKISAAIREANSDPQMERIAIALESIAQYMAESQG